MLLFEISASGQFVNSFNFAAFEDRDLAPSFDRIELILDMILLLFIAYYVAQELAEFTISKQDYMSDGWNLLDWVTLIILGVVYAMKIMLWSAAGREEVFGCFCCLGWIGYGGWISMYIYGGF